MTGLKEMLITLCGVIGSFISTMFGGWDDGMATLIIFMAIDYITGLILAGVFKKSPKSETGALQSKAGLIGLCKKGLMLAIVLVAVRLDLVIGTTFIRDATIIAFISNETISIIENCGIIGIPIPKPIAKGIDILKQKGNEDKQ